MSKLQCALSAHLLASPEWKDLWAPAARIAFGFSVLAVFLFFNFTETCAAQKLATFPVRLFALPVKTLALVAVPMLSGAGVVALLYVLWATLVFAPLEQGTPVVVPALLLATGMMSYLAVMWALPRFGLGRLFLSGAIGVVLLWGLVFPDALLPAGLANASPLVQETVKSAVLGLVSLAAFWWAWAALERQRHVRTGARKPAVASRNAGAGDAPARRPFASPAAAQFWLEWRRHGWLLPLMVLFFGLFAAGPLALMVDLDPGNSLTITGWLVLLPLALATLLGKAIAIPDFWSRDLLLPPFIALRPQSSGEIVVNRFRVAAISAGVSWVVLTACLLVMLGAWGDSSLVRQYCQEFRQGHSAPAQLLLLVLGTLSLFLLTWRQLIISLYLGMYGRAGLFTGAVIFSFALYFVGWPWFVNWVLGQGLSYCEPMVQWRWLLVLITALFTIKMCLASWTWFVLCRRHLLPVRQVILYWLLWGGCTTWLVMSAELAIPGFDWVRHVGAMLGLLAWPLVRPGLAVITLAANRHRVTSAGRRRPAPLANPVLAGPGGADLSSALLQPGTPSTWALVMALAAPSLVLSAGAVSTAAVVWGGVPHEVNAGEGRLRLLQIGRGSPTVVLESDLTGLIEDWWPVQRELARSVRVVAYERAGRGGSSPMPSSASAKGAMRQLHTALLNAQAPPPYLLVGAGLGASLVPVFASLYPNEVGGLVLLDPPQIETSTEAMDWLRQNRPEQLAEIEEWLKKYIVEVRGYGIREFKKAERKLDKLAPEARQKARLVLWDEVTDGTLYGMGIHVGHMALGSISEFARMDSIVLEDRAAWPLPRVPVAVVTGLKRGLLTTVETESLDEDSAEQKLARHREWVSRVPGANQVITLESGGNIPADQPELVVETVKSILRRMDSPPAKAP